MRSEQQAAQGQCHARSIQLIGLTLLSPCVQGSSLSEIEPADEQPSSRGALVHALQARIRTLERELRDSDNTHRLRCVSVICC